MGNDRTVHTAFLIENIQTALRIGTDIQTDQAGRRRLHVEEFHIISHVNHIGAFRQTVQGITGNVLIAFHELALCLKLLRRDRLC